MFADFGSATNKTVDLTFLEYTKLLPIVTFFVIVHFVWSKCLITNVEARSILWTVVYSKNLVLCFNILHYETSILKQFEGLTVASQLSL